jgi:phosphopantothenoylcysteine decarboxylase/phosphopantothenate--cysteine ligase
MARILITSGPTREYLDPVRFLTNGSSGRMGAALAEAALETGHQVIVVSGPVHISYPPRAEVVRVVTTEEMAAACHEHFLRCDGVIAAAAPCDFRPIQRYTRKIHRVGARWSLELEETPDIIASLAARRQHHWLVAFALETDSPRESAIQKLRRKGCDLIVLNEPEAIEAEETSVEVLNPAGETVAQFAGNKQQVARELIRLFERLLMHREPGSSQAFPGKRLSPNE